jgi:hypothetical protein
MAKKKRSPFNISGSLLGMTHVDSQAYGKHVRADRGTYKEATLNEVLQKNADDMRRVVVVAKLVKDALDPYRENFADGRWWSRLVALFKTHYEKGQPVDFSILEGHELYEEHTLERLMSRVDCEVKAGKGSVAITISYPWHPAFRGYRIGSYLVTLICVFIDGKDLDVEREVKEFPLIGRDEPLMPLQIQLPVPKKANVMICCVKAEGYYDDGRPSGSLKTKGMKIVKVAKIK